MPVARNVWHDSGACTQLGGAALDHAPGVDAVHCFVRQRAGAADGGAGEASLTRRQGVGLCRAELDL
jgi:hypothetical protein